MSPFLRIPYRKQNGTSLNSVRYKGWYVIIENLRMFDQIPGFMFGEPTEELLVETMATAIDKEAARQASMNALRDCIPRRLNHRGRPLAVADTAPSPELTLFSGGK